MKFGLPNADTWNTLPKMDTPVPPSPFENEFLTKFYFSTMQGTTPLTIAIVYFTSVHYLNKLIRSKQLQKAKEEEKKTDKAVKRLPAVPTAISKTSFFKFFVLLHNVLLCVYSVWTFVGMTSTIASTMGLFKMQIIPSFYEALNLNTENTTALRKLDVFFQSVCDSKNGIFSRVLSSTSKNLHNLEILGFWFYISKFYEVVDTIIILLKGRPSSLLQSYHHAGAMMCMWAGVRFQSPPIWIFVVFNSFIHSLMYFYYSLSCLHIRVPTIFKKSLTSMQITQFIVGGSFAVLHCFVWIYDVNNVNTIPGQPSTEAAKLVSCISTPDQALPVLINVAYLTPLTALFAAFYIESYFKKK